MAFPSTPLSERQLHCTVCQEVFTDPVCTPCGHTFCKACLRGFWEGSSACHCPLCKKSFEGPLDLSVNAVLAQITQDFKRRAPEAPRGGAKRRAEEPLLPPCEGDAQSRPADDLPGDPPLHLRDGTCAKHQQPLELFCSSDRACVCALCAEDDHGGHATAPLKRAWLRTRDELRAQVLRARQDVLDRQKKMEELKRRTRLSQEDSEKELKEGQQVLRALLRSVQECQAELPEVIEGKQRAVESRAQSLLEELEQEVRELKPRKAQLMQLLRCQDHMHVLQSFPSQPATPCYKDWDKVMVYTDLCVGTVRSVLSPLQETLGGKLRELMDAEFKKVRCYADDVTLDPLTAQQNLSVSENGKEVHYHCWTQAVADSPERFDVVCNVLGKERFTSGRHYWEVQVERKTSWYLGVVTASIGRKGKMFLQPKNGLWLLHLKEGKILKALDSPPVELSQSSGLKRVGVYVDYEEGQISFYNAEAGSHMYSFTGNTFTEELCLLLNPQAPDGVPMILSPVFQTE
ncbi:nuclear factor 7, brain-like [Anguilla anguilla]|uniref:nuclear factor 7, brain-like n=1 Tax=Anguilla anguilla TaxID=7936 RepID=UPI0015A8DCBE|nr:nuclear factor 7, brain-like [Anguilla anguilla]